ncbi:rhodanese-related sulfurtransferase [Anaerosolibacter carboniphilus]|uniref:Rhodanese-related sulfurtransferase n=1 Tax=Anaerosolibacter carboniphilus TaxID=1417629 RepID=A0A841KUB6_9FIRM|nr:rhodanese-like domain-containing protein [Anaerosolibacter carboniphilus]MBB6214522.1 rhodanese-related sulfurtransferase [Anaerosolibacter carboniphilus]
MLRSISAQELREKIENHEDLIIIDTRLPRFYKESHIPHAVNMPFVFEMPGEAYTLPKDKAIVVSCYIGRSSKAFAFMLSEKGYEKVLNLTGGYTAWKKEVEGDENYTFTLTEEDEE